MHVPRDALAFLDNMADILRLYKDPFQSEK